VKVIDAIARLRAKEVAARANAKAAAPAKRRLRR
jgi:hypothetical protein